MRSLRWTTSECRPETRPKGIKQMMDEQDKDQAQTQVVPQLKRRRRFRKRSRFKVPKIMPVPVRALWNLATEEERKRAHRTCASILEYWLGRRSKTEVMARLELPALRVWQLSQQALAGMLAGLLKQPRTRGRPAMPRDPESDPKLLRKRIEQLERELNLAQDVIKLLREFPGNRPQPQRKSRKTGSSSGKKKKQSPGSAGS